MGTKAKYSKSPRTKKTLHLTEEINCHLENITAELKLFCSTASQSDVVQALLEDVKGDWTNGKARRDLLSRLYTY